MFKCWFLMVCLGRLGREVSPLLSPSTGFRRGRSLTSGVSDADESCWGRRWSVLLDHRSWEMGQGRNAAALTGDGGACRGADRRIHQGCLSSSGASIVKRACPYFSWFVRPRECSRWKDVSAIFINQLFHTGSYGDDLFWPTET